MVHADELQRVLVFLTPKRYRTLLSSVLGLRTEEQRANLKREEALILALFDWMAHLGFLDEDQQRRIVERYDDWIRSAALPGAAQRGLYISDSNFVGCTGHNRWYNLTTDDWQPYTPGPVVTTVAVDLPALMRRLRKRLEEQGGIHAAAEHPVRGPDVLFSDPAPGSAG